MSNHHVRRVRLFSSTTSNGSTYEIISTPRLTTGVQTEQRGLLTRIATESGSLSVPMKSALRLLNWNQLFAKRLAP